MQNEVNISSLIQICFTAIRWWGQQEFYIHRIIGNLVLFSYQLTSERGRKSERERQTDRTVEERDIDKQYSLWEKERKRDRERNHQSVKRILCLICSKVFTIITVLFFLYLVVSEFNFFSWFIIFCLFLHFNYTMVKTIRRRQKHFLMSL